MPDVPEDRPTTERLAGVYVYVEGEEIVTLPLADGKPVEVPPEFRHPTIEQLAGVNILIEGDQAIYLNGTPPPAPEQP